MCEPNAKSQNSRNFDRFSYIVITVSVWTGAAEYLLHDDQLAWEHHNDLHHMLDDHQHHWLALIDQCDLLRLHDHLYIMIDHWLLRDDRDRHLLDHHLHGVPVDRHSHLLLLDHDLRWLTRLDEREVLCRREYCDHLLHNRDLLHLSVQHHHHLHTNKSEYPTNQSTHCIDSTRNHTSPMSCIDKLGDILRNPPQPITLCLVL